MNWLLTRTLIVNMCRKYGYDYFSGSYDSFLYLYYKKDTHGYSLYVALSNILKALGIQAHSLNCFIIPIINLSRYEGMRKKSVKKIYTSFEICLSLSNRLYREWKFFLEDKNFNTHTFHPHL